MNRFPDAGEELPVPHRNALDRKIDVEKDKARFEERMADRRQVSKHSVRPPRPLERLELDHTKLNLFVVDEKAKVLIGRPWLMFAICPFTKSILHCRLLSLPREHGAKR